MEFAPPQFAAIGGRQLAHEEISPQNPRGTVLLLCGMAAHGTWSTSREVMQALMPGDEEVESGEGAGRGYLRQLTACRAHDVYDRLGEITAPTRVIHGEADPLVLIENGRDLAARIPAARLAEYEGVGHIPEVECDERFNSDLLAFLP